MSNESRETGTALSREDAQAAPTPNPGSGGGFTLIEALVSLLILSVIFLGLQAGLMTAITVNTENLLRNEARKLAQERMDRYRTMSGTPPNIERITRQVRNYQVTFNVDNSDYNNGQHILRMVVRWNFQNEQQTLEYTSYIGG